MRRARSKLASASSFGDEIVGPETTMPRKRARSPARALRLRPVTRAPAQATPPPLGGVESGEQIESVVLAGARFPANAHAFAGHHRERRAPQHLDHAVTAAIALPQAIRAQKRVIHCAAPPRV